MGRRSDFCERSSPRPSSCWSLTCARVVVSGLDTRMAGCAVRTVTPDGTPIDARMDVWPTRLDTVLRHLAPAHAEQFIPCLRRLHNCCCHRSYTGLSDWLVSACIRSSRSDHSDDAPDTDHVLGFLRRHFLWDS